MIGFRQTTVIRIAVDQDAIGGSRTDLVRLPKGADTSLFGGWGVKI